MDKPSRNNGRHANDTGNHNTTRQHRITISFVTAVNVARGTSSSSLIVYNGNRFTLAASPKQQHKGGNDGQSFFSRNFPCHAHFSA